jgi:hypothetical protein
VVIAIEAVELHRGRRYEKLEEEVAPSSSSTSTPHLFFGSPAPTARRLAAKTISVALTIPAWTSLETGGVAP